MNIKKQIQRIVYIVVDKHGHLASGFLCGLTLAFFALSLAGSDARIVVPRGDQVGSYHQAALVQPTLQLPDVVVLSVASVSSSESSVASSSSSILRKAAPAPQPKVVVTQAEPIQESSSSSEAPVVQLPSSSSSESASSVSSVESSIASSSSSSVASSVPAPEPTPSSSSAPAQTDFPVFDHTSWPVGKVPNWGAMRTPQEWNRSYSQMTAADFVPIPRYEMSKLTIPMSSLVNPIKDENIPIITAKLFYSTRMWGSYDLDAGENTGTHGAIDMKLARGTPIGAIAGGRVAVVEKSQHLGLHVIIEHRLTNGETYYSIYGHFDSASVTEGQSVKPGQTVGYVGMTGNTSAPHLHLQIDKGQPGERHTPYEGGKTSEVVHPISFLSKYSKGE